MTNIDLIALDHLVPLDPEEIDELKRNYPSLLIKFEGDDVLKVVGPRRTVVDFVVDSLVGDDAYEAGVVLTYARQPNKDEHHAWRAVVKASNL